MTDKVTPGGLHKANAWRLEPPASPHEAQRCQGWGIRLSDKVRAELARGDFAEASRLALHGDGQTRDLAREYAFMVRGLGFTLQVLLGLLVDTPSWCVGPTRIDEQAVAEAELTLLLTRLRGSLRGGETEEATPSASAATDACIGALQWGQEHFGLDQARRADEIIQLLANGEMQSARDLLDAKDHAYLALHDVMIRFMADSFAWVARHFGRRALLEFHLATADGQRAGFEKWERMPAAEFAATTSFLLKQHMGRVQVQEDELRFTIRQSPCGSGGRLRLDGAYEGPQSLPFVEGPDPLTFGEARMPVYCTHCAIWNGAATLRWFGRAQWVFENPASEDGGCTLHIYKRHEDIPSDYARLVGLPAAGGPHEAR